MEMTVKPVLPQLESQPVNRQLGPAPPAPAQQRQSSRAFQHWPGFGLTIFIDIVEPVFARFPAGKRYVAVEETDHTLAIYKVSAGRTVLLGRSSDAAALREKLSRGRIREVELRIAPESLADARFKIPASGAQFANQLVESRLDRLTPWRKDTILYGFAVASAPGPDGQVDVDFAATSKTIASASIDRLSLLNLRASALGSADEPLGKALRVDLYGGRNNSTRHSLRRSIGLVAITAMIASMLACGLTLHASIQSAARIAELDAAIAKARNRLVLASGTTAERDADFAYIATKTPGTARFHLVDRLAAILPDTTYLEELDILPGEVRLAGISTEASSLIRLLDDDAAFSDVRFSAPVTRRDDSKDRFEISASYGESAKEVVK